MPCFNQPLYVWAADIVYDIKFLNETFKREFKRGLSKANIFFS
jgi:hypothetical protein